MDQFYRIPDQMFIADGIITKDGEKVKMSFLDMKVYLYVMRRWRHFYSEGNGYFETHNTIASVVRGSVRQVGESIRKWSDAGVIEVQRRGMGNSNYYKYVSIPIFYNDDVGMLKEIEKGFFDSNKERGKRKKQNEQQRDVWQNAPIDDIEPPF